MNNLDKKTIRRKKVQRSETGRTPKNLLMYYAGIVTFSFGLLLWVIEMENRYRYSNLMFVISFIIMILGLVFVYIGTQRKILNKNYREYYDLIYQNEMFTIDEISSHSNKPKEIVMYELQLLIKQGYFKNIRVNEIEQVITGAFVNSIKELIQRKMVRCQGCGASNEVVEYEVSECEYCGRKLSYK